ncbi:MAG: molybdopterin-dependent oxidoreductase [Sterolibacteriaceae bacterium MAG5]|nr:molybdopterin-dependent oxidoreductase [Candidatus Nitricoxidireducens bremensis]
MNETRSTCCYCGVGCGVVVEHDGERIVGVRGDPDHPANFGRLCTKGATLHLAAAPETLPLRAQSPELRLSKNAPRSRVSWDMALNHAAHRFADVIREHGPDAVAFYISGQLLTEDYYVFNKLAKGLVGTNNVDTNSRLCMSSAVTGYKLTLGADAPPCAYEDLGHADCLFIAGSNAAWAHPVLFRRIEDARAARPDMKIVVVDPRRTDTAEAADLHLALLPGTDIALYHAMLHVMLWEGLCDEDYIRAHTEGFDNLKTVVRDYTPALAADICGLKAEDIVTAARWFGAAGGNTLSLWCQGLNQSSHGSHNNAALIHLHLATGKIGKPGCGPFSLTGQPNAMGGREVGGMATLLSGHRDLADPQHRAEVARLWGVPAVPASPGLTAVELFDAVGAGRIKALWIACTNPAHSLPDARRVGAALAACDFVVVQDAYAHTDTTAYADLLLPAAGWGEKEGTVTNSERRISRVRAAVPPPGEARPDWLIARDFALQLGRALDRGEEAARLFPYRDTAAVFDEHRETTRGRDLDIAGLDYGLLETRGPQQWPFPAGAETGRPRLYGDGIFPTASGRARFLAFPHRPAAEAIDARHPLRLNTGRLRDQWHGMSRTGTVARLWSHEPRPVVELAAADMARRQIADGDLVALRSRRGEIVVAARSAAALRPGQAFMAMHWSAQALGTPGSNVLMPPVVDPLSKQPELKHAAIQVTKLTAPLCLVALRRAGPGENAGLVARLAPRLQPWLARFAHASLGLAGREHPVLVLRAWGEVPDDDALAALDRELGLDDAHALSFADARRGISKRAFIDGGLLAGVRLAGETAARDWLLDTMARGAPADEVRRWIFAPVFQPPVGGPARGRVVCNCFDVAEDEIRADLAAGLDLATIQERRKCGTSCGSCLPELKRIAGGP